VESDTYVEKNWSIVTILEHMLRRVGNKRKCGTFFKEECLA
jgi:hypothetical protein